MFPEVIGCFGSFAPQTKVRPSWDWSGHSLCPRSTLPQIRSLYLKPPRGWWPFSSSHLWCRVQCRPCRGTVLQSLCTLRPQVSILLSSFVWGSRWLGPGIPLSSAERPPPSTLAMAQWAPAWQHSLSSLTPEGCQVWGCSWRYAGGTWVIWPSPLSAASPGQCWEVLLLLWVLFWASLQL